MGIGRVDGILEGLNPAQREAAAAVRGPVAILAGAGTGKTTTITHRIACQVASWTFPPGRILAVTFTEKAAGELKARLARLGVEGVEASPPKPSAPSSSALGQKSAGTSSTHTRASPTQHPTRSAGRRGSPSSRSATSNTPAERSAAPTG